MKGLEPGLALKKRPKVIRKRSIGRKKPEKYQDYNGIRTRDLRDTRALFDQLSCDKRLVLSNELINVELPP